MTEATPFLPGLSPLRRKPPTGSALLSLDELTPREREVLEVIAQGLDNAGIAARLKISEKTARNHVSLIFSKLGVNSRAEVIVLAREAGFGRRNLP
jgi:DNA-binding NarL/FixJ family response regulator